MSRKAKKDEEIEVIEETQSKEVKEVMPELDHRGVIMR